MIDTKDIKEKIKRLVDITGEKKGRLQAIYKMTSMQTVAISEGDGELLRAYIKEKQRHIDAIDKLDERFTRIYNKDIRENLYTPKKDQKEPRDSTLYTELKTLIDEVQGLIGKIHHIEKENDIMAKKAMSELKDKIGQVQVGKKGYNAYNREYIPGDGIYIDEKQ